MPVTFPEKIFSPSPRVVEYEPFFYQKNSPFEEKGVVYMRTLDFLTLVMNFVEKTLQVSPLAFMKWMENPAAFCDSDLREQSRDRLCSHGVLGKSISHPQWEIQFRLCR